MPVDTSHTLYARYQSEWVKARDAVDGQIAVHQKTTTYLPALDSEGDADYAKRQARALFFGAASRTVDGLAGMIFRRGPRAEVPSAMTEWLDDVTSDGTDHAEFSRRMAREVLTTGRAGVLVDFPETQTDEDGNPVNLTVAEAERARRVPFLRMYPAEAVVNWRDRRLPNGAWGLALVILEEEYEEQDTDDEFEYRTERQYRVLDFDENGHYRQRLFRQESSGAVGNTAQSTRTASTNSLKKNIDGWGAIEETVPVFGGKPIDYIPFSFVTPSGNTTDISKPPLLDMIDVNFQHYRVSADYYHGLHYVGLPTPYVTGISEEEAEELDSIGPQSLWTVSSPDAKIGYLQVDAKGFEALQREMTNLEHRMAVLGARILAPTDKLAAESGAALSIRSNSENSVLVAIARAVGFAIEDALRTAAEWMGFEGGDINYELNTDFVAKEMDPQALTAMVSAYQSGSISYTTFFEALKRGELIRADRSQEDEQEEIEEAAEALGMMAADGPEDAATRRGGSSQASLDADDGVDEDR